MFEKYISQVKIYNDKRRVLKRDFSSENIYYDKSRSLRRDFSTRGEKGVHAGSRKKVQQLTQRHVTLFQIINIYE